MEREPIKIFSDKKRAIIFHIALFLFSLAFLIFIPSSDDSFWDKLFIILGALLGISISIFGFFTLLSRRFKYYGSETEEYSKEANLGLTEPYFILHDRIQKRLNLNKVIFYKDVTSIVAIPDSVGEDYFYYIEIKDIAGKKMILQDWDDDASYFLKMFQTNQQVFVKEPPTFEEYKQKYNRIKRFLASFLFHLSPLKTVLWASTHQREQ